MLWELDMDYDEKSFDTRGCGCSGSGRFGESVLGNDDVAPTTRVTPGTLKCAKKMGKSEVHTLTFLFQESSKLLYNRVYIIGM